MEALGIVRLFFDISAIGIVNELKRIQSAKKKLI